MEIEIKSIQIIDNQKQTIKQKGTANLVNHPKGIILTWEVPEENQVNQMTILENKIILKRHNQTMIFEQGKTTKSNLQTPYGNLRLNLTTTHMEIIRQNEQIQKIILHYEIELENTKPYQNQIEIKIQ